MTCRNAHKHSHAYTHKSVLICAKHLIIVRDLNFSGSSNLSLLNKIVRKQIFCPLLLNHFVKMMSLESESFDVGAPDFLSKEVSTGTSIMACEFNGGVVIGADSRTTMGTYVANRVSDKLTKITDKIYCCRSGSSADTQAVADIVAYRLNLFQMENNEEPTVHAAANVFKDICYNYREQLTAGIICAGWDKRNGGQVYCIPLGGMLSREPVTIGGSGSTYIYGYVDSTYKTDMTEEECVKFVLNGLTLAMARDGSSGGVARIGIIDKDGCRRKVFLGNELPQFYQG